MFNVTIKLLRKIAEGETGPMWREYREFAMGGNNAIAFFQSAHKFIATAFIHGAIDKLTIESTDAGHIQYKLSGVTGHVEGWLAGLVGEFEYRPSHAKHQPTVDGEKSLETPA